MRRWAIAAFLLLWSLPAPAEDAEALNENDIKAAIAAFSNWTNAYLAADYKAQYALVDPRIKRWHDEKRWRKVMRLAAKKDGLATKVNIRSAVPTTGDKLPCTEMHHCYPADLVAVFLILDTSYSKAKPPQPEFAVMVKTDGGWLLGGGTFPNRPFGETMVILDKKDEQRYKPEIYR